MKDFEKKTYDFDRGRHAGVGKDYVRISCSVQKYINICESDNHRVAF